MSSGISLIVGLGNPGPEYAETRHNAGFRFLDALLADSGERRRPESRFTAEAARLRIGGSEVWLLAPMTFMNHSGEAVSRFARYYKIPVGQILVAYDEIDLPPGAVRLKWGGGAAGHNGLTDVIEQLGSPEFLRLRIGVGHPGSAAQVVSYVLRRPPVAEQSLIDEAIAAAKDHIGDIVQGQYQKVMNSLHRLGK
ncbi:peptidyl-tRNA hydrolase [Sulfurifustis variabilis]|uniref:Peptidyl-tRNA hydrolase n=1 Tax=Sulfurifustis variabilis TaxID=1675686 RepID=A0A1B4V103_9GAMM|nr:aminoacyl-tRNA hydrolase [Sulfurifustis variabilis]BAU47158.1 peptidyl-tRNA hydrolase [Sulfurifustis variabilis]